VILRIIKAASRIFYHGRRWWAHVASSFSLAHQYKAVLGAGGGGHTVDWRTLMGYCAPGEEYSDYCKIF